MTMADVKYYVFWNQTKKEVTVKTSTSVPSGSKRIGDFTHPTEEDLLGSPDSHTLYQHVKEILYKTKPNGNAGFWPDTITDMARLTIKVA